MPSSEEQAWEMESTSAILFFATMVFCACCWLTMLSRKRTVQAVAGGDGDAAARKPKNKKKNALGTLLREADGAPMAIGGHGGGSADGGRAGGFKAAAHEATKPEGNSKLAAEKLFALLISPITPAQFYREYFEKKPLLVKRKNARFYDEFMTMAHVQMLVDKNLEWSYEVDATSYVGGKRTTHNGEGPALSTEVWERYGEGCSIRLLRPQRRLDHMCLLLSVLEEHWGSSAGANVYLTPAGTQGFAPHWDDIEAYILQTEGRKHWRVYAPRTEAETMPRFSSRNFEQAEIGAPILECVLDPGDLLYFPRGFIHQALCSLHRRARAHTHAYTHARARARTHACTRTHAYTNTHRGFINRAGAKTRTQHEAPPQHKQLS